MLCQKMNHPVASNGVLCARKRPKGRGINPGFTIKLLPILLAFVVASSFFGQRLLYAQENPAGIIVETMNSGGYTYALIEKNGSKTWVAVPQMLLAVGDNVEFYTGLSMGAYVSQTLGKTFDDIIFSSGVVALERVKRAKDLEAGAEKIQVKKAEGPDAYTIAELYMKKAELDGRRVVVRGQVYKVSKFMGSTWIRIKDGSGSRKKGNHKLIATSSGTAKKGDVITLAGILAADKNFGGLSFEVVVEQATLQSQ